MGKDLEALRHFLEAMSGSTKEIRLSLAQIELILRDRLPDEAKSDDAWWANQILGPGMQQQSWLDAEWKTGIVDLFQHEVQFLRLGEENNHIRHGIKDWFAWRRDYLQVRWNNRYPADSHHMDVRTRSNKVYWLIYHEDNPCQQTISRFGKTCGWIKFICRGKLIEIADNYVFPDHRGDGLGSQSLRRFIQLARCNEFTRIEAIAQPEDPYPLEKLIAWYGKYGFVQITSGSRKLVLDLAA
ncbi:MAG: GNAT family N-acetyltransferase [Anaerolineaceae bacterium]|nr:GNAT family N-acetyltransferase [Anaerolineaceae bacterium]